MFIHKHSLYLVLEYAYTDLFKLSSNPPQPLTKGQIKGIMKALLEAVSYIHSKRILHRVLIDCKQ